jgi:hypothetical protein
MFGGGTLLAPLSARLLAHFQKPTRASSRIDSDMQHAGQDHLFRCREAGALGDTPPRAAVFREKCFCAFRNATPRSVRDAKQRRQG